MTFNPAQDPGSFVVTDPTPPAPEITTTSTKPEKWFTEEQVEAIRKQEKDKLYGRIEDTDTRAKAMQEQLDTLNKEREELQRFQTEQRLKEEEERKHREEEELSAKELLLRKEDEINQKLVAYQQETESRLKQLQDERDFAAAALDKEQQYQQLQSYKARRLAEETEIMPELTPFLAGNSEEEIEASILSLKAQSDAIVASIQAHLPPTPVRGISPTGGVPTGPMENTSVHKTVTDADVRNMDMKEYEKYRDQLLRQARPRRG